MNTKTIELYTGILELEREITIANGSTQIDIFESDEGWYIQTYTLNTVKDSDSYLLNDDDGGLCTGSARDAVEFFLPKGV